MHLDYLYHKQTNKHHFKIRGLKNMQYYKKKKEFPSFW